MNPQFLTTYFVLTFFGVLNAAYLTYTHYKKKPLVCPLDHNCNIVTESKWSTIFGIRNEILGILFFASMLIGMLLVLFMSVYASLLLSLIVLGSGIGLLYSFFLAYIQAFVIKDYCFYCLISAFLTLLLFLNSIALYF